MLPYYLWFGTFIKAVQWASGHKYQYNSVEYINSQFINDLWVITFVKAVQQASGHK